MGGGGNAFFFLVWVGGKPLFFALGGGRSKLFTYLNSGDVCRSNIYLLVGVATLKAILGVGG